MATGVAGTAGGAVKGVLDTAGNTVGLSIFVSALFFIEAYDANIHKFWTHRKYFTTQRSFSF